MVRLVANIIAGGQTLYGRAIGVLMLDTCFPRIPGDVGNATTFDFPVAYKVVKNATAERACEKVDFRLLELFIKAAQELEMEGVKAITTSCGFLAIFQRELASAVKVPVFTSSLMQVGLVHRMLGKGKRIGIITARKQNLTTKHFEAIGIESVPMVIYGMDAADEWQSSIHEAARPGVKDPVMNLDKMKSEIVEVAQTMARENPDVGAIVFECTNMPPYASSVQRATGLPVFDITTLIDYVYRAIVRKQFQGWL